MRAAAWANPDGGWWPAMQIGNPAAGPGHGSIRILEYSHSPDRPGAVARADEIINAGLSASGVSPENVPFEHKEEKPMGIADGQAWEREDGEPEKSPLESGIEFMRNHEPESPPAVEPVEMPTLKPGAFCWLGACRESLTANHPGQDPRAVFLKMLDARQSIETARAGIRELVLISHGMSLFAGWWHDLQTGEVTGSVPEKIALCHSELSEALEADRKGAMDDKLPDRPGIEVELADVMHRVLDLAGALDVDLAGAFIDKMLHNATRPDHDPRNRMKPGGKAY